MEEDEILKVVIVTVHVTRCPLFSCHNVEVWFYYSWPIIFSYIAMIYFPRLWYIFSYVWWVCYSCLAPQQNHLRVKEYSSCYSWFFCLTERSVINLFTHEPYMNIQDSLLVHSGICCTVGPVVYHHWQPSVNKCFCGDEFSAIDNVITSLSHLLMYIYTNQIGGRMKFNHIKFR